MFENLFFEPGNFLMNLPMMGMGMGAIFAVIGVIILVTMAIGNLTSG